MAFAMGGGGQVMNALDIDFDSIVELNDHAKQARERREVAEARAAFLAKGKPAMTRPSALLTRASEIVPEPIQWLWPGWLPAGKLTLLAGSPGTGKTTLALALAAAITRGSEWPDGAACSR